MKIERTKNASRNIMVGVILKIYQMIVPFLMRTAMIYFMGVQYLGLNSLFTSILQVLNLAELGVGSAMVFSMYKPIAEDDDSTICALMALYKKYYRIIGLVIGGVGIVLTPFIPYLIKGEIPDGLNIYILYLLNLAATVFTYWLFAYKNCLLQAFQRIDVSSLIMIVTNTIQYAVQLLVMIFSKNYYVFIIVLLVTQILNNLVTAFIVSKMFPQFAAKGELPLDERNKINSRIKDLFTAKLGGIILGSVDTIVISAFLGLTVLAIYQNYYFILTAVIGLVEIILSSIMAGLGNSFVTETKEKNFKDLIKFSFLFLWLITICTCCFLCLYQPFMKLWVGEDLCLSISVVICFCIYFYVYEINRLINVYKDAAGLWHADRFRPLVTSLANLGGNLIMVRFWGLYGVLLSTVFSMILIGMPWVLYNIFTVFFDRKYALPYIWMLIKNTVISVIICSITYAICAMIKVGDLANLIIGAIICIIIPNVLLFLIHHNKQEFRDGALIVDRMTKGKLGVGKLFIK